MDLTRRRLFAVLLAAPLTAVRGQVPGALPPLSRIEEDRIKKYLPRTFAKLQRREPVFVAVCGDEISSYASPGLPVTATTHLTAWYARFLDRIGAAFYYHGGVLDLRQPSQETSRVLEQQWKDYRKQRAEWERTKEGEPPRTPGIPEETPGGPRADLSVADMVRMSLPPNVRVPQTNAFYAANYTTEGAVAVQVLDPLRSLVFHTEEAALTDIVFIGCGARDALEGASLAAFRTVLEAAVAECRARGSDVILAGPPPALDEADERAAIGRARPWAAVMREVAEASGVFFADLGAAAVFGASDLLNRTPESAFRSVLPAVRAMFDHGAKVQNSFHPNAAAHTRMGERTAEWMRRGEPERPWEISGSTLNLGGGLNGEDVLILRIASKAAKPVTVAVCPLRFTGWAVKQGWVDRVHTFQPGRGARLIKVPVVRTAEAVPGHEPYVRGSVVICDDEYQHLADVKAELHPCALLWPEERADAASGAQLLKCALVNKGKTDLDAALTFDWMGQQSPLPAVRVAPGASQPIVLQLPLPPANGSARFRQVVTVNVTADGATQQFTRRIEGVQHLGLSKKVPLVPTARWRTGAAEDPTVVVPQLSITANLSGIYFLIEVPAEVTADEVAGKPWGRLEVQLDGRKPGENGTLGSVGRVIVELPHAEGRARVLQPVRAAVFGIRSSHQCAADSIIGVVRSQSDGGRRIQFNMARANLPEHEWSLDGAGQNDLGINVRLMLCDARTGSWSDAKTFVLTASAFPWADARSLTNLELRPDPAAKWSLRIA
jgi:hypothetical protein